MKRCTAKKICAALGRCLLVTLLGCSFAVAEWTQSYVISWYEPAMYFGGTDGVLAPGTDCPDGTYREPDWVEVLVDAGYTREQAEWLTNPANPTMIGGSGQTQLAFRGENRANVYFHPESTPEVGLPPVQHNIGEGLNLDGDPDTGFISPAGEPGIDNNFYRALGCWKLYRGPRRESQNALGLNEAMRFGKWTAVVVLHGQGTDPMNDPNVTVGIYTSDDKIVLSSTGKVDEDYTFRIKPHQKFEAILHGRSINGRITTEPAPEIFLHSGEVFDYFHVVMMQLLQARADLRMTANGELEGYIGGYMPWQPLYDLFASTGPFLERQAWIRTPDLYYAFRRYADYSPTGAGGKKTHISYALYVAAKPAYVVTPDATALQRIPVSYKDIAKPIPKKVIPSIDFTPLPEDQLLPPKTNRQAANMSPRE